MNFPGFYLGVASSDSDSGILTLTQPYINPDKPTTDFCSGHQFMLRKGLDGKEGTVSLESVANPGEGLGLKRAWTPHGLIAQERRLRFVCLLAFRSKGTLLLVISSPIFSKGPLCRPQPGEGPREVPARMPPRRPARRAPRKDSASARPKTSRFSAARAAGYAPR